VLRFVSEIIMCLDEDGDGGEEEESDRRGEME
jgi:hypothetical protein